MIDDERLADLLLAWEEGFERGVDTPCDKLCQESPELAAPLAERIASLKRMNWLEPKNQPRGTRQMTVHVEQPQGEPSRNGAAKLHPGAEPVSGYRLIEKIGKGAFGEVWSASSVGKQFAIKFFHGNLDAKDARVRAERELEGLTRIKKVKHPLILEIHSLIVKDDTLILITELADLSLEKLFAKIRDQVPMVRRCAYALCLLQNVAEALDHLQARYNLVHLDIKPANLLLVRGMCKIGDFGTVFHFRSSQAPAQEVFLSVPSSTDSDQIETVRYGSCWAVPWEKVFRRDATLLTSEGVFTPYYAPPEAFQGKNSRSFDQYSLALTFCELVAGEIPFKSDFQLIQRNEGRMELDFLPEPLRSVIGRALAPKADMRFPSCVAFINALHVALVPLVEDDKRNNNWEGWLLEMEEAAGTKSPDMLADAAVRSVSWQRTALAGKLLLPFLTLLIATLKWIVHVTNKMESLFWLVLPQRRNPTIVAFLHLAAIVLVCVVLVSIHQNWFSRFRLDKDGQKLEMKDQKQNIPSRP